MTNDSGTGTGSGDAAIYMIVIADRSEGKPSNYAVAEMQAVEFMGLRCFKARLANIDPRHFMSERIAYFPVDKVLLIVEFESMAAYQEAGKRHKEAGMGAPKSDVAANQA